MRHVSVLAILLVLIALTVGCSGGNAGLTSPVLSDGVNEVQTTPGLDDSRQAEIPDYPEEMTEANEHPLQGQRLQGSHALWGLYVFLIDTTENTVEIVPLRNADLHLNVLRFLEPNGQVGMVQVVGGLNWNTDKTQLDLDVRLTHPFPGLMQFSGFDVKGILITRGSFSGLSDPDLVMSSTDEMHLLNADGYTRWWNPREFPGNTIFSYTDGALGFKDDVWHFTSTLNGFKYFCDSLATDDPIEGLDQDDRGVFRAGESNTRHYTIAVPHFPSSLIFNYAIDANWAPPLVKPPEVPDDFPPDANQPEPWRLAVNEVENSLFYDEDISEQGGRLVLNVLVYDWQDPTQAPAGSVVRLVGEWPGLFDPTNADFVSMEDGYALWTITLVPKTDALSSTDDIEYMIWAESVDGSGYGGILDPDVPLISAARYSATVGDEEPNLSPQISEGVTGNASPGLTVETYTVIASDPNDDALSYSWTTAPLISDDPGNGDGTIEIDWALFGFGNFTVECLVSDGINPAVAATPLEVLVGNTPPEVGPIEGPTDVTAADTDANYSVFAIDIDTGQTLSYTWSFVPDGDPEDFIIPGDVGDGSLTIDFSTVDPGLYNINVLVSDGFADVPAIPITVTHHNTAPTVGDVTGKNPVDSLDTNELYQALWSDPDTTQTLSFLWSVVPDGDPEDFSLPSNPDGSINLDWSGFAIGDWSANVRADDGIDQTAGAALVVTKENLPPEVGSVTGPTNVSGSDTAAAYNAPISDPDPGQVLTALWSVVPNGDPADFIIPSEPDLSVVIDWSGYPDGVYDVNVRVSDSYDQTDGILLTVSKFDNDPPSVGAVTGPTSVYHSDTASEYNATISDPEGDPLTVNWSVVPNGDPPDYSIPGNDTDPLTVDWSTYPDLGDYDINVQAFDAFHPPVDGTLLTVSLLNTPPTVGPVSGPTPVDGNDTAATYSATVNDIDPTQTLSILWSVVPQGSPGNYVIPDTGGGSVDINWAGYAVGSYDVNLIVDDGFGGVEGTLFTVSRVNTVPNIGSITGPPLTYCDDTGPLYSAPIVDPDTTQTLTILWSVVLSGSFPNFVIPDNGDGSVNIDWSGYVVADYDINVQVNDGFTVVEGTILTVTRANTPPIVGAVTGPDMVTDLDTENYYLDPATTDCDTGQTLQHWFSVEPFGDPPDYSIFSASGDINVDWSTYGVGIFTIGCRVNDGFDQSYATPLDVTVALHPCVGSAHTYGGLITPAKYSIIALSVLPRADIAFLDGGVTGLKGLGLVQVGPSTLGVFNADMAGAPGIPWKYYLGHQDAAVSIDADPVEGRILVVTALEPQLIKIFDSSIILGNPIIGMIDSFDPLITWVAIDVEEDGDFWVVMRDATLEVTYKLVRFNWLDEDPYYEIDLISVLDITMYTGTDTDIFDIAINHQADMLYLLEAGPLNQGTMHTFQVVDGAPAYFMGTLGHVLFSQQLDFDTGGWTGFAGYGDIDIDHVNGDQERCRILLYGRLEDLSSELIRLEADTLTVLDVQNYPEAWPAFAINPDPDETVRNLIMPGSDSMGFWDTPLDW